MAREDYCGMVFSERLNREIAVFRKRNESCEDALKRVSEAHKIKKA